jgi:K+-transporting ATPase ATPase C chain
MRTFMIAARMLMLMTLLCGALYPLLVTGLAQALFSKQAQGSPAFQNGQLKGSRLLAQSCSQARYFWPRPSAVGYDTLSSGGSNLSPASEKLRQQVMARGAALRLAHGLPPEAALPADMLLASASGLDPHISPEAARLQAGRVAQARHMGPEARLRLLSLLDSKVEDPQFRVLGEPRVNVLELNLALDETLQ